MKENQVKIIMILTVTSLILIFIGLSYAYFSAFNNQGSTAQATIDTGKMLITYNDGTDNLVPVTDIQPSDNILVNKTFSLTGTNTVTGVTSSDGLNMPYKVGLKYISTFSDGQIHYYIKEVNRPNGSNVTVEYTGTTNQTVQGNTTYTGYSHGTLKKGNKYTEMVAGEFPVSTSNQTITFNLILQFPDTGENQDSEKGATINGKIMVNYEPPKATTFDADSWSTIAAVVKDGQLDVYPVGSLKEVGIAGINYTVRVANNSTPEECNGDDFSETACGFVVEFVDVLEERQMNSTKTNVGGWPATSMRTYANGYFYNNLPSELQKVIIDTKVITGHGSTSGETNFTSVDKIYLLSAHEVFWEDGTSNRVSIRDTAWEQTRQLDYYIGKEIASNNYGGVKQYNGSNTWWWLRTARSGYSGDFLIVNNVGGLGEYSATDTNCFAPAFRIG